MTNTTLLFLFSHLPTSMLEVMIQSTYICASTLR